jgi:hypothetical protein
VLSRKKNLPNIPFIYTLETEREGKRMKKAILITVLTLSALALTGCAGTDRAQKKGDNNVYHLTAVSKPYTAGVLASAKYKAYVAPYQVNEEPRGKQEFRTINYTEFIKAALAKRFGTNITFVDTKGADIEIVMKRKISGYDLKYSDFHFITTQVNGVIVTAKGEIYRRKPHWPPTAEDVAAEIESAADALVSVFKETPDGKIEVAPLRVSVDNDLRYYKESNGVTVMEGPLGYNVEKRIDVDSPQ